MTETLPRIAGATDSTREYAPRPEESVSRGEPGWVGRSSGRRTDSVFVPVLAAIATRLINLLTWPEEWDGYQVAPSRDAVKHAFSWIKDLYEDISSEDASTAGGEWLDPLIVADAHGNVVFEWLRSHNRLVVYVSPNTVEYLKAWGPDIWSDMEDGELQTPEQRRALWRWLMG